MKILIAPDKFKGSITAKEVCDAISRGFIQQEKSLEIIAHPMADGGEGSIEILSQHLKLKSQTIETTDPLGREISCEYFTSDQVAFIELASASGLVLLEEKERNPLKTSTFGTGKMVVDALSKGFQNIYLFLGGSATNDAGIGIAAALGCEFLNDKKQMLQPIGENLPLIKFIQRNSLFDFKKINLTLLCDVTNPLFGMNGAAYVYAPQKGATPTQVKYLDNGLRQFSEVLKNQTGVEVNELLGVGAAGGIGASMISLFGAKMEKGFEAISKLTHLEKQVQQADWVISGEGKLDTQSLQGKVIDGVAQLCKKYDKPLALFVGKNDLSYTELKHLKIAHLASILENAKDEKDAMTNGVNYLEKMAAYFCKSGFQS